MQRLFDHLNASLSGHLAARDALVMAVACDDTAVVAVLKALEGLDDQSQSELFWIFTDPFENPGDFCEAIFKALETKVNAVRLSQPGRHLPVWPEIPPALRSRSMPPALRLRGLMEYTRDRLPFPEGCLSAWGLFPLQLKDALKWSMFLRECLAHEQPFPWCHHLRVFVRDLPGHPALKAGLNGLPGVAAAELDLSPESIRHALEADAADPTRPPDARMQNLLVLAGMDFAHKHYETAIQKYQTVFNHFDKAGNATLTAMALNGLGETHRAMGNSQVAAACFQAALPAAGASAVPPIPLLAILFGNLAEMAAAQKQWSDAEVFYNGSAAFAVSLRDPQLRIKSLENLGTARYAQGRKEEGIKTWLDAAIVAQKLRLEELRDGVLKRLRQHFEAERDRAGWETLMNRVRAVQPEPFVTQASVPTH